MKRKFRSVFTFTLMLYASTALADITLVPVGKHRYDQPELAPTDVKLLGAEKFKIAIRTRGLSGVLELDCGDLPGCREDEHICEDISFNQQLELGVDPNTGDVAGRTRGHLDLAGDFKFTARVQGNATCLPFGGRACGQLVVDLEARGPFVDPGDPSRTGLIRMQLLGSLVRHGEASNWAALSANISLGFALPDDVAELLSAKCNM